MNKLSFVKVIIYIYLVFFLLLTFTGCDKKNIKKILYYENPMDPAIKSDKPMKDEMGMNYIPVYDETKIVKVDNSKRKILYYVNPMDPTIKSDKFMKDSMGMDYVPVYDEGNEKNDNDILSTIKLTQTQEKLIGVKTAKVEYKKPENIITTAGKIIYNEQKKILISSRFSGRIDKLFVNFTGMTVKRNDPLLQIYSPELISTQQELLEIYKNKSLNPEYLTSAKLKLKFWGITDSQIELILKNNEIITEFTIYSQVNGTITKMDAINGKYINQGESLYELSDLGKVWVEADIYEQDIQSIKIGSIIEITSMSFPDKIFKSKISFINPYVDPETRTVKIRSEFDNKDGILKPGMFVTTSLISSTSEKMLVIPSNALLDTGTRQIVYVYLGEGKYAGKEIIVKQKIGDYYPVVSGLKENEEVVINANFLIDSESQLKGIIYK
jgi:membrane fusion protein, copper/silver efflux system